MDADATPATIRFEELSAREAPFRLFRLAHGGTMPSDERHRVDVVLLHGLTGDALATWGLRSEASGAVTQGWPVELARQLQDRATLWTAGYAAPLRAPSSTPQSIHEQAREALAILCHHGLGQRKLILVGHSLGGILVKALLDAARHSEDRHERALFAHVHGVVFIGTPHAGSSLTQWRRAVPLVAWAAAKGLGWVALTLLGSYVAVGTALTINFLDWSWTATVTGLAAMAGVPLLAYALGTLAKPSSHVLALDPDNPALYDLTDDYRRAVAARPFATRAFFERRPMWKLFTAVPRASADPGVTDCVPAGIDADHVRMCKGVHAEPIARAVAALVDVARRGVDRAVFESHLRLDECDSATRQRLDVLRDPGSQCLIKRFADAKGDRAGAEEALRSHLRRLIGQGSFAPDAVELALAETSTYDVDVFVWCLWQERQAIRAQQKLRTRAHAAMAAWPEDFKRERPTLIPFYRPMRTLEHVLRGDLTDFSRETEAQALLALICSARDSLERACTTVHGEIGGRRWALDGDAGTRRMLLRMEYTLRAVDSVCASVDAHTKSRHEDAGQHRAELNALHRRLEAAVAALETALQDRVPTTVAAPTTPDKHRPDGTGPQGR